MAAEDTLIESLRDYVEETLKNQIEQNNDLGLVSQTEFDDLEYRVSSLEKECEDQETKKIVTELLDKVGMLELQISTLDEMQKTIFEVYIKFMEDSRVKIKELENKKFSIWDIFSGKVKFFGQKCGMYMQGKPK